MFRISHIRAVNTDERLTPIEIKGLLAMTSLDGLIRQAVADAFSEAGLLSDGKVSAAAVTDGKGRYAMAAVHAALAKCSMPLSMAARIEIKNTLARYSLLK
jgi:hypothetical protein